MTEIAHQLSDRTAHGSVSVARTGTRTYQGLNESGEIVLVGPAGTPGHFSPGELLKIALAACAGMSSDRVISRRLGDDYDTTIWVHGLADESDRYSEVDEEMLLDTTGLSDEDRTALLAIIQKSILASCTIERTLSGPVTIHHSIDGTPR